MAVLFVAVLIVGTPGAAATSGPGARPGGEPSADASRTGPYRPPVDALVTDPFRPPTTRFGPGNRGLEYATSGETVGAIGAGVVVFAGQVAGRLVVSIVHPDGLRSSLTGLRTIAVAVGDVVEAGQTVGTAGPALHLGVRSGGRYLDPASLFGAAPRAPRHAVLVPSRPAGRFGGPPGR
jgi:murein DD-endopeptidase MepM/ murein hydrolase activator NlpD